MPDSTPRFDIPYPVSTDPAYMFPIIQDTAQSIDDALTSIASTLETSTSAKAEWRPLGWSPSITGVVVGNGVQSFYAFNLADLVVCSYSLTAAASAPTTAFAGAVPITLSLPVQSAGPSAALCIFSVPSLSPSKLMGTVTVEKNAASARINGMSVQGSINYQGNPSDAVGLGNTAAWAAGQSLSAGFVYRILPGAVALPVWNDVIAGEPARPGDPSPVDWTWVIANFADWLNTISGTRKP